MAVRSRRSEPYPAAAEPPLARCQVAASAVQQAAEEAAAKPVGGVDGKGFAASGKPASKG
eukprot:11203996-Lingulodinium_polyedra.AAC.1